MEGKIDITKPPKHSILAKPTDDTVKRNIGSYERLLETKIDPAKSADIEAVILIEFLDVDSEWALHVRRGVAEISPNIPEKVDGTIKMPCKTWAEIQAGISSFDKAISDGTIKVEGNEKKVRGALNSFD